MSDEFLEQLKFTDKDSFRFALHDWLELCGDALRVGKEPRLVVDFHRPNAPTIRIIVVEGHDD